MKFSLEQPLSSIVSLLVGRRGGVLSVSAVLGNAFLSIFKVQKGISTFIFNILQINTLLIDFCYYWVVQWIPFLMLDEQSCFCNLSLPGAKFKV